MTAIRTDIPPLPQQLAHLPIDARGYPVPAFVAWIKGLPEFRVIAPGRVLHCLKHKLCWVCGKPLGTLPPVFVIGPMCAINRISSEPPSHAHCARYSVTACPFLRKPQMVRRENDLPEEIVVAAGLPVARNPGVTLLWFANKWEIWPEERGLLFHFTNDPKMVEWWAQGRKATRAEVDESIASGLPLLRRQAELQGPEALAELEQIQRRATRLLPRGDVK